MKKKSKERETPERTEADAAEEAPTEIPTHDHELARLQKEREQLEAKLQRAMADLQNFRKRQLRELEDVRRRTLEGLAHELLPVLDNFKLALQAHEQQSRTGTGDTGSMLEGLKMVQSLLGGALERHGLCEIRAMDRPFDPNLHEAVGVEPRSDVAEGTVVRVIQDGYTVADRVIRPTKVMVSGPVADEGKDDPAAGEPGGDPGRP